MKHSRHIAQHLALRHLLGIGVYHRDFGIWLRAECAWIGIDMRAVNRLTIRRQCEITCTTTGHEPFDFLSALQIDNRNIAAEAIGYVQDVPPAVENHTCRLEPGAQCLHDSQCCSVDDRNGIGRSIRYIEAEAIRCQRNSSRKVTNLDAAE